jgi:quercetin dioxygenase-like cupin family protein
LWERYHPGQATWTGVTGERMRTVEARRASASPHPRPEWFSGLVFVQSLNEAPDASGLEILAVFFEAGARTKPHTHSTDQLLYFLEGEGVVGTLVERRTYRSGGMTIIPATSGTGTVRHTRPVPVTCRSVRADLPRGRPRFPCTTGTPTWSA